MPLSSLPVREFSVFVTRVYQTLSNFREIWPKLELKSFLNVPHYIFSSNHTRSTHRTDCIVYRCYSNLPITASCLLCRHGRMCNQQRWLPTRVQEHARIVRVHVQQRIHLTREQARLQRRRMQTRDLGSARKDQQPQLSGFVPRPQRLRLAFHNHSGPQDQTGNYLSRTLSLLLHF